MQDQVAGKKGKTHKKFSASLEEGLFERVRGLPGQFSAHLSNALDVLSLLSWKRRKGIDSVSFSPDILPYHFSRQKGGGTCLAVLLPIS